MKQIRNKFISAVRIHLIRAGVVTLEGTESFYLNLSNPTNATIADSQGIGTISQYVAPTGNAYTDMILQVARARAGVSITATGTAISLTVTPNRGASPSGVAPLSVLFDTVATTTATTLPFHELYYVHHFGDDDQDVWQYGTQQAVNSKNVATGPIAAHVWERPGTYTVKTTAFHISSGGVLSISNTVTTTVTVSDPDVVYSGTNTVYIANGVVPTASDAGVLDGATYVNCTTWAQVCAQLTTSNRRVFLKRGHVWDSTGTAQYTTASGITLGCYGEGALPKIRNTAGVGDYYSLILDTGATDWRIMDLEFDGQQTSADTSHIRFIGSTGGGASCLYLRNYFHHFGGSIPASSDSFFVENRFHNLMGKGGNVGLYPNQSSRFAILGNSINDCLNVEMNIRVQGGKKFVISNNYLADPSSAGDKHALAIRGWSYPFNGTDYTENFVVSDNVLKGYSYALLQVESQNSSSDERIQNGIIERNTIIPTGSTYGTIASARHNLTIRNNIYDMTGATGSAVVVSPTDFMVPDSTYIYNNTIYSGSATMFSAVYIGNNGTTGYPTGTIVKNNVAYAPNSTKDGANNGSQGSFIFNTGATVDATNNSTDPQVKSTSPGFTVPAAELMDWKTSGYTTSGGTYVPTYEDAFGNIKASSTYMGAISTPTQTPVVVPIVNVSRTSGKGPLAVYFDASQTYINLRNVNPTHEYFFAWDFGDDVGATWSYGAVTGQNKNVEYGHQAAHVYETAGTKTWTLAIMDSSGAITTTTGSITITAWTEAETIYISNGSMPTAGANGVGAGAAGYYNETTWAGVISRFATNKRVRLNNSSTWTPLSGDGYKVIPAGMQLEGYGAGTAWTVSTGTDAWNGVFNLNGVSDIRVIGGKHVGLGKGSPSQEWSFLHNTSVTTAPQNVLLMNFEATAAASLVEYASDIGGSNFFIVNVNAHDYGLTETVSTNTGAYPYFIFYIQNLAMLGCRTFNIQTGHSARMGNRKCVISNCTFDTPRNWVGAGVPSGHLLTIRGHSNHSTADIAAWNGIWTEKYNIRNNKFISPTDSWPLLHTAPQNDQDGSRLRNFVIESNYFESTDATGIITRVSYNYTVRNNIFKKTIGDYNIEVSSSSYTGTPSCISAKFYNNTSWKTQQTASNHGLSFIGINQSNNSNAISGIDIKNNLIYAPLDVADANWSGTTAAVYTTTGLATAGIVSGNSTTTQIKNTRPWAATSPVSMADYTPTGYALNTGVTVPVLKNFFGTTITGSRNIGAI